MCSAGPTRWWLPFQWRLAIVDNTDRRQVHADVLHPSIIGIGFEPQPLQHGNRGSSPLGTPIFPTLSCGSSGLPCPVPRGIGGAHDSPDGLCRHRRPGASERPYLRQSGGLFRRRDAAVPEPFLRAGPGRGGVRVRGSQIAALEHQVSVLGLRGLYVNLAGTCSTTAISWRPTIGPRSSARPCCRSSARKSSVNPWAAGDRGLCGGEQGGERHRVAVR